MTYITQYSNKNQHLGAISFTGTFLYFLYLLKAAQSPLSMQYTVANRSKLLFLEHNKSPLNIFYNLPLNVPPSKLL
ncbi:hypothetical protein CW304_09305 [Bacillus sp. UFRGS-B20]|nr:hypothetical protein CW304_09305 [Bacillus sp. UFRGS-B20]